MALFVVTPVLGPVLSLSASSVFSGPLTLVLSSPLPDLPPATSPRESELPSPASLCLPVATITVLAFELPFPLLSPLPLSLALTSLPELALALLSELALVSLVALTSLLELALALLLELALVSLLAFVSELTVAPPLDLACVLAGAGLLDLAAGSAGFAGELLEAFGAGAADGAGWLLEPPF